MEDASHYGTVRYRIYQAWSQVPCIHGKSSTNKAKVKAKQIEIFGSIIESVKSESEK